MKSFDVISIGAATVDIFAKSNDFLVKNNLLSLDYSSKNEIQQSLICSGGGATNSSVAFSRLGLKSACISLVGVDFFSKFIFNDLKKDSVYSGFVGQSEKDDTDFSIILVDQTGGRTILTDRGKSRLEESNFSWDKLKTKWLYITSLEGNIALLEKIIGFAKENNIKIAFNPGSRELSQKKILIPLLKHLDFLSLNQEELEMLSISNPNHLGAEIVTITNGRHGANIFLKGKHFYHRALISRPVDETGAGDSFGSAFIAAVIYGLSISVALKWAIRNSASVVSFLGAKPGLLTLTKIKKYK